MLYGFIGCSADARIALFSLGRYRYNKGCDMHASVFVYILIGIGLLCWAVFLFRFSFSPFSLMIFMLKQLSRACETFLID